MIETKKTRKMEDRLKPKRGFFAQFFREILKEFTLIAIVFAAATGVAAIVCFFYDVPLWFSLIGGFISIGVVFSLRSASLFDW